jgi:carbon-monoxide dehydrogenase large subunit
MEYPLPTAADVPGVELRHLECPSPRNPLGVKGVGEGGAISGPAAISNAIEDALRPFGVRVLEVPLHPAKLRALLAR